MDTVFSPTEPYPPTLMNFEQMFPTEESCRHYLEQIRWPDGFVCPDCSSKQAWVRSRGLWTCGGCGLETSLTSRTIFEGTRKPLRLWFRVMWMLTGPKDGVSAQDLQRQLGFSRYETVWTWLHKLRRAMVRPRRDRLSGQVEVDETYVGGVERGVKGRQTLTKSIVAIAAEKRGRYIGRIRLQHVPDVTTENLYPFVLNSIVPGSTIHTDAWPAYQCLQEKGYKHKVSNISQSDRLAHELLPRVHRIASLLKRWILGTHHGSIDPGHLQYYLDEFTFRFNRRASSSRGKLFHKLLEQAVELHGVSRERIVQKI